MFDSILDSILQELEDKLEELDRNFNIRIEMKFGIPYVAHTTVELKEEKSG